MLSRETRFRCQAGTKAEAAKRNVFERFERMNNHKENEMDASHLCHSSEVRHEGDG